MPFTLDHIRDVKVYQPKGGYRFSVDALLLYSFVNVPLVKKIADLGAGSGIIGLLLAKKYPAASVSLFELQHRLASAAQKNIGLNNLGERVRVVKADIRNIDRITAAVVQAGSFDVVVSNPPFRKEQSGLLNPDEERAVARHEIKLKLPELVRAAHYLLKIKGRIFLIHHPGRLAELVTALREKRIEVKRLRFVHSRASSEAKMVLVEAAHGGKVGLKIESPLFIFKGDGEYTEEILAMYATE